VIRGDRQVWPRRLADPFLGTGTTKIAFTHPRL
jgi:hypothetical protein